MTGFWSPPVEWTGETAFVLGCGPSLTAEIVDTIKGRRVVAVNAAYRLAPWAPYLVFSDRGWFDHRRPAIEAFRGVVVTPSRRPAEVLPAKVMRVAVARTGVFPQPGSGPIRHGNSSGALGVSLAVALGAERVVLLGFDMRVVDGRSHWHAEYWARPAENFEPVYRERFVPAFNGWCAQAMAMGVRIVNATAGSALQEFPFVTLDEVL